MATEMFSYQLKHRKQGLPKQVREWLEGIQATAEPERIGVLILSRPNHDMKTAVVCLSFADWVDLHGEVQAQREDSDLDR